MLSWKMLPFAHSALWTGVMWVCTGCFAILSSMNASRYRRLPYFTLGLVIFGGISVVISFLVIIHISYLPPVFPVTNFTDLKDITKMDHFTVQYEASEIQRMVVSESTMVVLSAINMLAACCELAFGLGQFRSGYFAFLRRD